MYAVSYGADASKTGQGYSVRQFTLSPFPPNIFYERSTAIPDDNTPRKRRKTEVVSKPSITLWADFLREVEGFEVQHVHGMGKLAFDFVEGPLVKALKSGDW
jgi:midasin